MVVQEAIRVRIATKWVCMLFLILSIFFAMEKLSSLGRVSLCRIEELDRESLCRIEELDNT